MNTKWKKMGKLDLRSAFSKCPITSFHRAIRKLCPKAESVSDIGVSANTNSHFKSKLEEYYKPEYGHMPKRKFDMAIGMAILQYAPATIEDAEDFYIYTKKENKK